MINRLYDQYTAEPAQRRDSSVYIALAGAEHTPVEALSIDQFGTLQSEVIEQLLPNADTGDLKKLQRLARLWRQDPREEPALVLAEVFKPEVVRLIGAEPERCDLPLASLDLPCFGVSPRLSANSDECPELYLLWTGAGQQITAAAVSEAAELATLCREKRLQQDNTLLAALLRPTRVPVTLIGPGAEGLEPDPRRNIAILRLADAVQAAYEGDLARGLRRKVRVQIRLTALSPFRTHGALPPGSPLFRGREKELDFIRARIREASILIVGSRQVGKTSLLNQVLHWARQQADLEPFYLDLQGVKTLEEFLRALKLEAENEQHSEPVRAALPDLDKDPRTALACLTRQVQRAGKRAVFLFNEVDGLVEHGEALIEVWRGLNDQGLARFIMVGYAVIARFGTSDSPFFHFTQGTSFGGKAIALTALSSEAAESLLELLRGADLGLIWSSEEERKAAYALLLERSYRIPWVLQYYGQQLVQHMEEQRRDVLTWNDVERVVAREGNVVWQYMAGIDYKSLGYKGFERAQRPGFQLILFAIARARYFLGGSKAPIRDPLLGVKYSLAEGLGFTVGEAQEAVEQTMDQLLMGFERVALKAWLKGLDLNDALRRLTLTLALEPDPNQNDRYGFLLHILPLELSRRIEREGPTLDNLIINEAIEFLRLMQDSD